jgi:uncharacterized protein YqeY
MTLQEQLMEDLKVAMKARDELKVSTIRLLRAQMKDFQIAKGSPLTPEDEITVLTSAAKKRKEAIEAYQKSDRADLLNKEQVELRIISSYLPKPLSAEEVEKIVAEVIKEVGAASQKDFGKAMQAAMAKLKGRADGKLVQELVKKKLS